DPDARYDFLLVIEPTGHQDGRHELMRRGVETHFRVNVEPEDRPMDVYVLTAPESWRSTANEALGSDGGGFILRPSWNSVWPTWAANHRRSSRSRLDSRRPNRCTGRCARRRSDGSRCPTAPWRSSAARSSKRSIDRSWMKRVEERHDLELADGPGDLAGRLRNELELELTPDRRSVPWIVVRENG